MSPEEWLEERNKLSECLRAHPYDSSAYLERAAAYAGLGFPDLAAGDANKALLLTDEALDEGAEYHEKALEAFRNNFKFSDRGSEANGDEKDEDVRQAAQRTAVSARSALARYLHESGCIQSAAEISRRGSNPSPLEDWFNEHCAASGLPKDAPLTIQDLPSRGTARREIYSWNKHEPNRFSPQSLAFLNKEMAKVAPDLEVRAVELPTLASSASGATNGESALRSANPTSNLQLGIFAKRSISPGTTILRETSLITATNRPLDPFCDGCSAPFPLPSTASSTTVECPECYDTYFCTPACLARAQQEYHGAICGYDIDVLGAEKAPVKYSSDTLYLLLLRRVLAMAVHQEVSPLELRDTKYIWGDFSTTDARKESRLPFSYRYNIELPLAILEKMDINIFEPPVPGLSETWVVNTLYAKFRGTASAFLSPLSKKPETSAVHPMWCLANHDCAPNVAWDWRGGEIRFWVRKKEERIGGADKEGEWEGIKEGEEVKSHYCDVGMSVNDRREWALGSLGGVCRCDRCLREEREEAQVETQT
ncbi:MAG: hypothetical protein M1824_001264 [Vezdaea acicularis]|nr:MAG: hypothetical protein M1824_001264 [Vezdaea acicularis]